MWKLREQRKGDRELRGVCLCLGGGGGGGGGGCMDGWEGGGEAT